MTSIDAERLISLASERLLAAEEHPGYGIGVLTYGAIDECGASVVASPTEKNPAHHDILSSERQSRKLAQATTVIDWPTVAITVGNGEA
ncbi:MAG TPA: hypothetical protein VJB57_02855 [Dehalococcoidia bacterium]|nr:hypothetical protein [Dehalococcoidia bacterium]